MTGRHTESEFDELKQANDHLRKENDELIRQSDEKLKKMDDTIASLQAKFDEMSEEGMTKDEKIASLQAKVDEINDHDVERQAEKDVDDEIEKHEMAARIASYMVQAGDIEQANIKEKIAELKLEDAKILQAQLPFAEMAAKKAMEAKQASLRSNPRYYVDEQVNMQASQSVNSELMALRGALWA